MSILVSDLENFVEEDIRLRPEELAADETDNQRRKKRGIRDSLSHRWPLSAPVHYMLNSYSK